MKKFILISALLVMFAVPQFNNAFASVINKTEIEAGSNDVAYTERVKIGDIWYIIEYNSDGGIIKIYADIRQCD